MKTDAKTMAEIYRHMADNLDAGKHSFDGIQYKSDLGCWIDKQYADTDGNILYRIKPKTIIVNGVEIPKPLDVSEIEDDGHYYHVANYKMLAYEDHGASIKKDGVLFVYKTREEAIEASKKLFGIE